MSHCFLPDRVPDTFYLAVATQELFFVNAEDQKMVEAQRPLMDRLIELAEETRSTLNHTKPYVQQKT